MVFGKSLYGRSRGNAVYYVVTELKLIDLFGFESYIGPGNIGSRTTGSYKAGSRSANTCNMGLHLIYTWLDV